jgi:hypothetical protein
MKILIGIILGMMLIGFAIAVQSVEFNYEFNNSKSMAYSNIIKDDSIVMNVYTNVQSLSCKYSGVAGLDYNSMDGTFDFSYLSLHKKSFSYLEEGIHSYYVKCRDENGTIGSESEVVFSIINPVKAHVIMSKSSPVNSGLLEITLKTTKQLSQKPVLSYSFDGTKYESIPLTGSNDFWEGYIIIPNNIGEVIGSFKFRGIDLDGIVGEEITEGELFLVDTKIPEIITEIDAESRDKDVFIEWRFNEEFSYFNIYRSKFPNVDYADFYKKIDKKEYRDNDVEEGRAYYYRVAAVDKAGNEGPLSYEISTVALRADNELNVEEGEGLDYELLGIIDSFLYDLESVRKDIIAARDNMANNNEYSLEIDVFDLVSASDSSLKEIEKLEEEVNGFKNQKITKTELEKKITNSRSKMNVIKKNSPESLSLVSSSEYSSNYNEDLMRELLLSLNYDIGDLNSIIKKSIEVMDNSAFNYKVDMRNIDIYYMDGTKFEKTLIIKELTSFSDNGSIVEFIPKAIADSVSDVKFEDSRYSVLKEDSIVSFPKDIGKIIYSINSKADIESVKQGSTFFMIERESEKDNITGLSIFDGGVNKKLILPAFGLFIIGIFLFVFYKSKNQKNNINLLDEIADKLSESKIYVETKNILELDRIYSELKELYKSLDNKNKSEVYAKLNNFGNQIKSLKYKDGSNK